MRIRIYHPEPDKIFVFGAELDNDSKSIYTWFVIFRILGDDIHIEASDGDRVEIPKVALRLFMETQELEN